MTSLPKAFAIEALILLVFSLLPKGKFLPADVDLQIHFTYFVVNPYVVCFAMASFLCLCAAGYSVLARQHASGSLAFRNHHVCHRPVLDIFCGEQTGQLQLLSAVVLMVACLIVLLSP